MNTHVKAILVGVLFGLAGYFWGLKVYFVGNRERLHYYEKISKEGKNTIASLDSVYQETTIKIGGGKTKNYSSKYFFTVNGADYSGTYDFENPKDLKSKSIKVKYLPQDPSVNATDIDKKLRMAKEHASSKANLWIGLAMMLLSLLMIGTGIKNLIKRTPEPQVE